MPMIEYNTKVNKNTDVRHTYAVSMTNKPIWAITIYDRGDIVREYKINYSLYFLYITIIFVVLLFIMVLARIIKDFYKG